MVRFSDLLGGNDDSDETRPAPVSAPPSAREAVPIEPDPEPLTEPDAEATLAAAASPEDVLDRLTQYASTARAGEQIPNPVDEHPPPQRVEALAPAPASVPDEPVHEFEPSGDDLLPR